MKLKNLALYAFFVLFVIALSAPCKVFSEQLTPELCKSKAEAAAKLLNDKGEGAYAELKDPNGSFRFAEGQGYVWVQDEQPIMLMHPIKPALDGTDLSESQDLNGMYLFVAFADTAEDYGSGWVPYTWPKPGEEKESPKVSYVVKAQNGGKTYIVGCGMYDVTPEDIKTKFPNDSVYEE